MRADLRDSRTATHSRSFGIALGFAAVAIIAVLPLRQGSTFGHASSLVGVAAILASVLTLGWTFSAHAGRGISAGGTCCAVGAALLDLVAIYTLISRLMAF